MTSEYNFKTGSRRFLLGGLTGLFILSLVFSLSCGAKEESSTTAPVTTPVTTPPPSDTTPPPPPPAPAAFSASNLSIQPAEVEAGEAVTISISIANSGGSQGSHEAVLNINSVQEEAKSVTVAAGSSKTVNFSVTRTDAATYAVTINGLSGSFTVTPRWSADGVINADEYARTKSFGDNGEFELYWTSDEQYIYIAIRALTEGWVSIGIQPEPESKQNADIIFGFVRDGETIIYDRFGAKHPGVHPEDAELGGGNDILEFGGKEEAGYTVIEFKRLLNTGDQFDQPLFPGENNILWGYGSKDSPISGHSDSRGYGVIDI